MMRLSYFAVYAAVVLFAQPVLAAPVGSEFAYQGQLRDRGVAASGTYDFKFALYTAASGGTAADTISLDRINVSEGLFNATIDFSDVPYNGQALWIEVSVRQSGSNDSYTTLEPRQALTATPYALYALNSATSAGPVAPPSPSFGPLLNQTVRANDNTSWSLPYSGTTSSTEGSPAAAFSIIESGSGFAIYGQASVAGGVRGVSTSANGLRGDSSSGNGVYGSAGGGSGITIPSNAGVVGDSANGTGIRGMSNAANGVRGDSNSANGVYGFYQSGSGYAPPTHAGVVGDSPINGVYGQSSATTFQTGAALTGVDTMGGPGLYSYVIAPSGTSVLATNDSANGKGDIIQAWHKGGVKAHIDTQGYVFANGGFFGMNSPDPNFTVYATAGIPADGYGDGVGSTTTGVAVRAEARVQGAQAALIATGANQDNCNPALPNEVCPGAPGGSSSIQAAGNMYLNGELFVQYGSGINVTNGNIVAAGLSISGQKNFVEPHPSDPSKEIVFTSLEGPEAGTYFRGTAKIVNGEAIIDVPEAFRLTTSPQGMTVQVTPIGDIAALGVMSKNLDRIVVHGTQDVEFDYMVNGVRAGFEQHPTIAANTMFVPKNGKSDMSKGLAPEITRRLKANGTLNADGTVNLQTAHRLGWDRSVSWNALEASTGAAPASQR